MHVDIDDAVQLRVQGSGKQRGGRQLCAPAAGMQKSKAWKLS